MVIYDFEYDGVLLSEMGYMLCKFDSKSSDTVSNGSELKFDNVSTLNGSKYDLVSYEYDGFLTGTLSICKNPCWYDGEANISYDEFRKLMSWLNRKEYHTLRFITEEHANVYYQASFNVKRVMVGNQIAGAELEYFTDQPFGNESERILKYTDVNSTVIHNESDEEGYIYPQVEITVKQNGNIVITNNFEERTTQINNCTAGEIITMDYPVITSSVTSHKIQDDFNWNFFRLCKEFNNGRNQVTWNSNVSSIIIKYSPIVKMGIVGD